MSTAINNIISTLFLNNGVYKDDHSTTNKNGYKAAAIGRFVTANEEHIVLLQNCTACLNKMYLDNNGVPRLSTTSVGGVVRKASSIEDAVLAFNKSSTRSQIVEVIYF
jgi:hypothetical protein